MIFDLLDVFWQSKVNLRLILRIPFSRTGNKTGIMVSIFKALYSFPFHLGLNEKRQIKCKYSGQEVLVSSFSKSYLLMTGIFSLFLNFFFGYFLAYF